MDELRTHARGHGDWAAAFAALPQETPPPGGWQTLTARLARRRGALHWRQWGGVAAMLLLGIALFWRLQMPGVETPSARSVTGGTPPVADDAALHTELAALQAEAAQLEALLPMIQDDRISSGTAAMLAGELEQRLALIDAGLARPELTPGQALGLWQARVDTLRTLAGLEGTRRWMAANGDPYDPALVRVY